MKMTLVIDTDDVEGIRDTFKIAGHFYRKYASAGPKYGHVLRYGKIKHIKMLRTFAKEAINAYDQGEDPAGLKFTKQYADKLFLADPDNPNI
jgi:hypothetical protein